MSNTMIRLSIATALALASTQALAVPFNSFDPRSMAMGGTGVAVANTTTAPFFNPSLLSVMPDNDDFAIELPTVGVRAYDPEDFRDSIDTFQDSGLDTQLTDLVNSVNAAPPPATQQDLYDLAQLYRNTATATDELNAGLQGPQGDALASRRDRGHRRQGGGGAGLKVGMSAKVDILVAEKADVGIAGATRTATTAAGGGRWLPRTETRPFALGSAGRGDAAALRFGRRTRAGREGGGERDGPPSAGGRKSETEGMTPTGAAWLVGVRVASCRGRSGTLSWRPRRRSRDRRGTCRNCVCFGPCGVDQGTVATRSVVAVAGGPVVPETMASVSR